MYKSRVCLFLALRSFSFSKANQASELWRDPFSFSWLCQDQFISVYSGAPYCALPLCPCISFARPLFWILLEMNRRHWVGAKAGIRTARFTLSWRWTNFENVKKGEVMIQLYFNSSCSRITADARSWGKSQRHTDWLDTSFISSAIQTTWSKENLETQTLHS